MQLDNRAWLMWGIAMSLPALVGRNPFVLGELLIIAIAVRSIVPANHDWAWVLRLVSLFIAISVVFNVLTVHSGDRVLGRVHDDLPIVGGAITLNAVTYGVASGLSIFVIVLVWTQVASQLNWSMLMRQIPARLSNVAAAGSVAWSYLPSMRTSLREIRETQVSRGWRVRRVRDLPALIVPILAGGLERSLVTAEVLETRGFGAALDEAPSCLSSVRMLGGLVAIVSCMYCLAVGQTIAAASLALTGSLMLLTEVRREHGRPRITRLRDVRWTTNDSMCTACSGVALAVVVTAFSSNSTALAFNPYPELTAPSTNPLVMGGLLLLFAPAALVALSDQ